MADYRLYFLRLEHVDAASPFTAEDDETAIALAREKLDGRDAELWSGARVVQRFPAPQGEGRSGG